MMIKKITGIVFMIVMLLSLTSVAYANEYNADDPWSVNYTGTEIASNFSSDEMSQSIGDMQPGDSLSFSVKLTTDVEDTDYWMSNTAVRSFEDNETASGGAYSYTLTYSKDGKKTVLYDSAGVGGEDKTGGTGLHKATGALEDFFYLDTLNPGEKGSVTLTVALDGTTQNNSYQTADAEIDLTFAAETTEHTVVPPDDEDTEDSDKDKQPGDSVQTGDSTNLMPVYIIAIVSGILLLILAIVNRRRDRKGGQDA